MLFGRPKQSSAFSVNFHQYKGKWVLRTVSKDEVLYQVYDKYQEGKLTNLVFETNDITSMALTVALLTEECSIPVVEDLPDDYIYGN